MKLGTLKSLAKDAVRLGDIGFMPSKTLCPWRGSARHRFSVYRRDDVYFCIVCRKAFTVGAGTYVAPHPGVQREIGEALHENFVILYP